MRPRLESAPFDASKSSYLEVEMPRGVHRFRLPPLSVQHRITELHEAARAEGGLPVSKALERGAVAVGAAWLHETSEIEAEYPIDDTDHALTAYAREVQRELEDEGYEPSEIMYLGTEILRAMRARVVEDSRALELADFCAARQAPPSSG